MYIFGYGSLMYPSGINGRGMDYIYSWKDLTIATLLGHKRGMFAYCEYNERTYYGIMKSKNDTVNGVVFKIHSDTDFENLMLDEQSGKTYEKPVYEIVKVTGSIFPNIFTDVITLVNIKDKSGYGKISEGYAKHVYEGIQPLGASFRADFLKTGGQKQ